MTNGTLPTGMGAFGFPVLRFQPFFRSIFRFLYKKSSVLVYVAVSVPSNPYIFKQKTIRLQIAFHVVFTLCLSIRGQCAYAFAKYIIGFRISSVSLCGIFVFRTIHTVTYCSGVEDVYSAYLKSA